MLRLAACSALQAQDTGLGGGVACLSLPGMIRAAYSNRSLLRSLSMRLLRWAASASCARSSACTATGRSSTAPGTQLWLTGYVSRGPHRDPLPARHGWVQARCTLLTLPAALLGLSAAVPGGSPGPEGRLSASS